MRIKNVVKNKPDEITLQFTSKIAVGFAFSLALMYAVYFIIGKLTLNVIIGGLYTSVLWVFDFFLIGLLIQRIFGEVAEKQRSDREIEEITIQMQSRMRVSYNMRMIALFGLLVLGIAVFKFDPLATILPSVFPSIVIRILQIMEARKAPDSKGSEEP